LKTRAMAQDGPMLLSLLAMRNKECNAGYAFMDSECTGFCLISFVVKGEKKEGMYSNIILGFQGSSAKGFAQAGLPHSCVIPV
jgi:hypothetical protein